MTITIRSALSDEIDLVLELWKAGQPVPSSTDDPPGLLGLLRRDPTLTPIARDVAMIQHWLSDDPGAD